MTGGAADPNEDLRAYVARGLTQRLGPPGRTNSGQMVWICRFGDEPALVTVAERGPAGAPVLRVLQAPDGSCVEVCAVKYLDASSRAAADLAISQLSKEGHA
jgi:hypothetical protein